MVQESSAACRASMGLAFKASSDPKHAGGDPPQVRDLACGGPKLRDLIAIFFLCQSGFRLLMPIRVRGATQRPLDRPYTLLVTIATFDPKGSDLLVFTIYYLLFTIYYLLFNFLKSQKRV